MRSAKRIVGGEIYYVSVPFPLCSLLAADALTQIEIAKADLSEYDERGSRELKASREKNET